MRQLKLIASVLLVMGLAAGWAYVTRDTSAGSATGLLAAVFLGLPAALLLEFLCGAALRIAQHWPAPLRAAYAIAALLVLAGLCAGPVYLVRYWVAG